MMKWFCKIMGHKWIMTFPFENDPLRWKFICKRCGRFRYTMPQDCDMTVGCPGWPDCGCGTQSGPHTCEYRVECWRRYRLLGIDPHNPDPDGSDYHLMNTIDEKVAREWGKK